MKVTEAKVIKLDTQNSLKGFASITLDEELVIKGLKIVDGKKGLFVSMPNEKGKDDKYYDTVFPLNKELRSDIEDAVLDAYDEAEDPKKSSRRSK